MGARGWLAWLAAVAVAACFGWAAPADAFVYWANYDAGTIGRANLDGTGANQSFITGASIPVGVAVDGGHVYWANAGTNSIGRANLDGTGANQSFITGASALAGWRSTPPTSTGPTSARARSGAPTWTARAPTRASSPAPATRCGVAVDAGHVYWTNAGTGHDRARQPGRHGRQPELHHRRQPTRRGGGRRRPRLLGQHVRGTIGRANLDGTGVNQSFITGASSPRGVAVDAAHVYWANPGTGTIGRANLDGTGANQSFITGASRPVRAWRSTAGRRGARRRVRRACRSAASRSASSGRRGR